MSAVAVAGVGNAYRLDDGAGVAFAALFAQRTPGVVDLGPIAEPLDLLGRLDGVDTLVLADAARTKAAAGSVEVTEIAPGDNTLDAAQRAPASTHGIGLLRALALAAVLGVLPPRVLLVAIEGERFGDGRGLSAPVARAVEDALAVVRRVIEERAGV